jgi:hypothetical protein
MTIVFLFTAVPIQCKLVDTLFHLRGQRTVSLVHVDQLRVAAALWKLHGTKRRRLGRLDIVRVIGVVSLAGNVDLPVLQLILIG